MMMKLATLTAVTFAFCAAAIAQPVSDADLARAVNECLSHRIVTQTHEDRKNVVSPPGRSWRTHRVYSLPKFTWQAGWEKCDAIMQESHNRSEMHRATAAPTQTPNFMNGVAGKLEHGK